MKSGRNLLFLIILFILPLFFTSCEEEEPGMRLTSTERVRVDTLYTQRVKGLRAELDSLCQLDFDERVKLAVDSIIEVRKAEEVRLRQRAIEN